MILEEKYQKTSNYNQTIVNFTSNQITNSNCTLFDIMSEYSLDISDATTINIDFDVSKEKIEESNRLL